MSSEQPQQPSEDELRAALEEQLRHITANDIVIQTAVSLINLAGRRLGLTPDTEAELDLDQVRTAIDATRALLPILEQSEPADALHPLRDALSQLQMEYAKRVQSAPPRAPAAAPQGEPATPPSEADKPGAGPAQSSGRLWVPSSADR
jgi:hypothetical protein